MKKDRRLHTFSLYISAWDDKDFAMDVAVNNADETDGPMLLSRKKAAKLVKKIMKLVGDFDE